MPVAVEQADSTNAHVPHELLPFLQSQSQTSLTRLYYRPSSCLSIFRLLAPLERQIIMNLLWLESSIPSSTMSSWVFLESRKLFDDATTTLAKLHIILNPSAKLGLNPTFKTSMRQAITGGGTSGSFGVPAEVDEKRPPPTVEALDAYALERWETILHYMVSSGTGQAPPKPSQGVLYLLGRSGLMAKQFGSQLQITSSGFQFLLHTPHAQLWELLLQYLQMVEERQMDLVEVLSFLFMLSTMELGRDYSIESLSETQKAMLEDLRDYGLIWQRKVGVHLIHYEEMARESVVDRIIGFLPEIQPDTIGNDPDFVFTSSTHRIRHEYEGTGSRRFYHSGDKLPVTAVLNLFASMKSRFPNLIIGSITRESVRKALANGITADQVLRFLPLHWMWLTRHDQIISYLTTYAHPQMRKNKPLLPVTVQDQIRLWELERNRIQSQEGKIS
ncbi:hypothetical protein EW146_g3684 [Bondarzewia mesenterica]|uniref:RNA polymerase II transcription factor B subunit 2 n=1 Tax=Bondarzewia mesenterica TaxID=1095465 RepID=A0A4S4LYC1_9AGAM|nr:hypothetical protein EW146_g3684 [Bondarzewia mesenterica]